MRGERTNTEILRPLLEEMIQDGQPHRAGSLYDRFVEQTGGVGIDGKKISRSAFEAFLRGQVLAENGSVKRVAYGVYQKRDHPQDQGLTIVRRDARIKYGLDGCGTSSHEPLLPQAQYDGHAERQGLSGQQEWEIFIPRRR